MALEGMPTDGTALRWLVLYGPGASSAEEYAEQVDACARADAEASLLERILETIRCSPLQTSTWTGLSRRTSGR